MEVQNMTASSTEAIEAMLASITVSAEFEKQQIDEEETEETEAQPYEELSDFLLADLEATVARAEVYEAQDAGADAIAVVTTTEKKREPKAAKAPKAPRVAKPGAAPAAPRKAVADLPDIVFQRTVGVGGTSMKADMLSLRPSQVKVAEKFDKLFVAIDAHKPTSKYVMTALAVLQKTGTMTSNDLVAAYMADDLGEGTARSQTGQIMHLFSVVGIALRAGQSLTVIPDSAVLENMNTIAAHATV